MVVAASGCERCGCLPARTKAKPTPPTPGAAQFATGSQSVSEYSGSLTVTVARTGGTVGAVTVDVAFSGTATGGGTDYATVPAGNPVTLNWADGDATPQNLTINITDDLIADDAETIILTLQNPTGGLAVGVPATITVTLIDTWTKAPGNPIFTGPAGTFSAAGVLTPCVIKRGPGDFAMWYVGFNAFEDFGYATSADGVTWSQTAGPLLGGGAMGAFDD
jgi:hypothetical protein